MNTPILSISNGELKEPIGEIVNCPHCSKYHEIKFAKNAITGEISPEITFYHCDYNGKTYLYGKKIL